MSRNNKIKIISSLILSTGIIITPVSNLISNYENVAKAEEIDKQKNNIQKHIEYIDNLIYLENNSLKINKISVLNYIKQNWKEININNQFNSPEDYYYKIELSVENVNNKVSSGWYKFTNEKGIIEKYTSKEWTNGYESYIYWWGAQFYAKTAQGAENLARDCEDNAYVGEGTSVVIGAFVAPVGLMIGLASLNYGYMATKVRRCFNDYGSVKLTLYAHGAYFETEPIK